MLRRVRTADVTARRRARRALGMRGRRRRGVARAARRRRRIRPARHRARRAGAVVTVRRAARLRRRIVRRRAAALRREAGETNDGSACAKRVLLPRTRHCVARVARDRRRAVRCHVRGMRAALRPGTVSAAMACAALAAAVSEVDSAVGVERAEPRKGGAGRVGLVMAARARTRMVIARRRAVTFVARERSARGSPGRLRSRAAAIVARSRALPRRRIEGRAAERDRIEPDLDVSVAVRAREGAALRPRMA